VDLSTLYAQLLFALFKRRLTRLLRESLGGNSRTVLVLNVSPALNNREETLSTLRFGRQAKRIVNKPRVNKDRSPAELLAILRNEDAEIARLRSQVCNRCVQRGGQRILFFCAARSCRNSIPAVAEALALEQSKVGARRSTCV